MVQDFLVARLQLICISTGLRDCALQWQHGISTRSLVRRRAAKMMGLLGRSSIQVSSFQFRPENATVETVNHASIPIREARARKFRYASSPPNIDQQPRSFDHQLNEICACAPRYIWPHRPLLLLQCHLFCLVAFSPSVSVQVHTLVALAARPSLHSHVHSIQTISPRVLPNPVNQFFQFAQWINNSTTNSRRAMKSTHRAIQAILPLNTHPMLLFKSITSSSRLISLINLSSLINTRTRLGAMDRGHSDCLTAALHLGPVRLP